MEYRVYLAGPITGLSYDGTMEWREFVKKRFDQMKSDEKRIIGVSPMRAKEYLSTIESIGHGNEKYGICSGGKAIVCRDRNDVMTSDAILINLLGAEKVSIGTVIEIGWADAFRKPVVLVMEKGRLNIHEHDMVSEMAGFWVETLEEGIHLINAILP